VEAKIEYSRNAQINAPHEKENKTIFPLFPSLGETLKKRRKMGKCFRFTGVLSSYIYTSCLFNILVACNCACIKPLLMEILLTFLPTVTSQNKDPIPSFVMFIILR
jgi:hypothetical protein